MALMIQVNKDLGEFSAGQVVRVEADAAGIPRSAYWRRRLQDAEHDGCCEVKRGSKQPAKKSKRAED